MISISPNFKAGLMSGLMLIIELHRLTPNFKPNFKTNFQNPKLATNICRFSKKNINSKK